MKRKFHFTSFIKVQIDRMYHLQTILKLKHLKVSYNTVTYSQNMVGGIPQSLLILQYRDNM